MVAPFINYSGIAKFENPIDKSLGVCYAGSQFIRTCDFADQQIMSKQISFTYPAQIMFVLSTITMERRLSAGREC